LAMLHPQQGQALLDKKYEFALRHLAPISHTAAQASAPAAAAPPSITLDPTKVAQRQLNQQSLLAAAVRTQKESSGSYFNTANTASSGGAHQQLIHVNMSYQSHQLQRERQLTQYVQQLEAEEKLVNNQAKANRLRALEQAHVVDRVKLHQAARQRVELQLRSHQRVPPQLLDKFGLADVQQQMATEHSQCAQERRATRDLPRFAHVEFNLPRIVESALNRQERLDAHRTRVANRVALEERVATGYARKRLQEHERLNKARRIGGLAPSAAAAAAEQLLNGGGMSNNDSDDDEQQQPRFASSPPPGVNLLSINKNTLAENPLSMYSTRRPGREEIRDARELEKQHALIVKETELEKRQLLREMKNIDAQTSIAEKEARRARGKARKDNSDSD
jgi:hypothetical protein